MQRTAAHNLASTARGGSAQTDGLRIESRKERPVHTHVLLRGVGHTQSRVAEAAAIPEAKCDSLLRVRDSLRREERGDHSRAGSSVGIRYSATDK